MERRFCIYEFLQTILGNLTQLFQTIAFQTTKSLKVLKGGQPTKNYSSVAGLWYIVQRLTIFLFQLGLRQKYSLWQFSWMKPRFKSRDGNFLGKRSLSLITFLKLIHLNFCTYEYRHRNSGEFRDPSLSEFSVPFLKFQSLIGIQSNWKRRCLKQLIYGVVKVRLRGWKKI